MLSKIFQALKEERKPLLGVCVQKSNRRTSLYIIDTIRYKVKRKLIWENAPAASFTLLNYGETALKRIIYLNGLDVATFF